MKNIILLLTTLALFAAPVFSQNGKKTKAKKRVLAPASTIAPIIPDDLAPPPAPPPPVPKRPETNTGDAPPPPPPPKSATKKRKPGSNVLKDETIGEWGVASLLIPDDLVDKKASQDEKKNGNVSWTTFERRWKQAVAAETSPLEVSLTVTTYNNPVSEVVPDLRPELATPENLVLLDLIAGEKQANTPGGFLKESKALEITGVKGEFFRADSPGSPEMFVIGWGTHRYYKGKLQNILLSITGDKDEIEKAQKILSSLKLE